MPETTTLSDLRDWLTAFEENQRHVIEGAEARIVFHEPESPTKTRQVVLAIHGFSACRQETAPISQRLAQRFHANLVEIRLAGHGMAQLGMTASAEDWLQSVVDGYDIASRLGDQVTMVSTSTGSPLACWADRHLRDAYGAPHAHLFMAPNFKINNPFDFVLTMPWARTLVPLLLGKERSWTPENAETARYWTSRYSIQAVIEMQKVVDWFRSQPSHNWTTPMALMVMDQDPTISAKAAKAVYQQWQSAYKAHLPITVEPGAIAHVFAGDIAGPQRTEAVIAAFSDFLSKVP